VSNVRGLAAVGERQRPDGVTVDRDRSIVPEYPLKRVFDFSLASLGLVASSPLWLIVAAAIKLEDGGPVFFTQNRWGRGRRPFRAYKFRSMVPDADRKFGGGQAVDGDKRLTRMGRLMRPTSLDELPQLLNIWRGDMSWVGPRALPMNEKQQRESDEVPDEGIRGFAERCRVRPGLTGIAQVFAPRDVPRRQKFRYDVLYIDLMSFSLDVRLVCLSIMVTLTGRWGRRGDKLARWLTHGPRWWRRGGRTTPGGRRSGSPAARPSGR
jgi:lipopolysaccharide/colanic/teichoic acid biosynthesis glycosyltransferase